MRDSAPRYGGSERPFPAERVLDDLAGAADAAAIARILARYAALRHWLLVAGAASATVVDHAYEAATIHVTALRPSTERALLLRITALAAGGGDRAGARAGGDGNAGRVAAALLAAAAMEAERAGERAGAGALWTAAGEAAVGAARGRRPPGP